MLKTHFTQNENKSFIFLKYLLAIVLLSIFYVCILSISTDNIKFAFSIIIFYLFTLCLYVFIYNQSRTISKIILTFFISFTLVLGIPANIGGLKGQEVIYCKYDTDKEEHYTYYGISDGLYQFTNEDYVILIPSDSGYIKYMRPSK